jgi:hypothetical protein
MAPDQKIPEKRLCRKQGYIEDANLIDNEEEFEHIDLDSRYSFCESDFDEVKLFKVMT